MPHKRNPILSERMIGMARVLRGYAVAGMENVALWHERDISHSSAERIILPDATTLLHYVLATFTGIMSGLLIDRDRMRANLEATRGLVYSQTVLLALVDTGFSRDQAYRIVQRCAARAWDEGRSRGRSRRAPRQSRSVLQPGCGTGQRGPRVRTASLAELTHPWPANA